MKLTQRQLGKLSTQFMQAGLFVAIVFATGWSSSFAAEPTEIARKAKAILQQHCHECHGEAGSADGGVNYMLNRDRLVKRRKVVPGQSAESPLFRQVKMGTMPKGSEPLSKDELETLKTWIDSGAADFNPQAEKRKFISLDDAFGFIRDDLRRLEKEDAEKLPYYRYFSITHLYNAGFSEDELQSYRVALAKLANSLSWKKRIVIPQPIDPAKTVLRINLTDFRWSPKTWSRILAEYPYGVRSTAPAMQFCYSATQTELPMIRADWFVAKASIPPLYHELLELPNSVRELEQLLRVDVEHNIESGEAARAAFNGSGVSSHNRLIERHDCDLTGGAYWKSYDFGDDKGRKNIFTFPLGPGGNRGFEHDGGELIFNLPNGLQAYLLVDQRGRRIDKGPISVVSDPRRPDKQVVNGLSCMSCHAEGLKRKSDEVRDAVLANQNAFSASEIVQVKKLYRPKQDFEKLLERDSDRFAKAVAETGGRATGEEPIVMLALRFEEDIDVELAAAELGLTIEQFFNGFAKSALLGRMVPNLKVPGGTVKREVFLSAFPDMVDDLMPGRFVTVAAKAAVRLPVGSSNLPTNSASAVPAGSLVEKVLTGDDVPVANPIQRLESQPWFELSNIRAGKTLRESMDLDFSFDGKWSGTLSIIVKTDGRRYRFVIPSSAFGKRTGTFRCSEENRVSWNWTPPPPVAPSSRYSPSRSKFPSTPSGKGLSGKGSVTVATPEPEPEIKFGADIEAYVLLTEKFGGESFTFKVSKSILRGKVAGVTLAREMRASEQKVIADWNKKVGPPPPPPAGYTVATQGTPLVAGTPVLGAFEGDWLEAELLMVGFNAAGRPDDENVVLHWPHLGHAGNVLSSRLRVAVSEETLRRLKSDPKSFAPTVEIAIGAVAPPPEGFVVLPDKVKLRPGTPLKHGTWSWDLTVVNESALNIEAFRDIQPSFVDKFQRKQLLIQKSVLQELADAGSEKKFADRLKEVRTRDPHAAARAAQSAVLMAARANRYPLTMEIPKNAARVTPETPLEVGTKLQVEWGRKWNDVTVVSIPEAGGVEVKWEGWSTVEAIPRECLIIDKEVLTKLEAKAKLADKSKTGNSKTTDEKPVPVTTPSNGREKFKVTLVEVGTKKIAVTKVVMEITGLDLADAKETVESVPIELKSNLSKDDADKWQTKLQEAGASAKVDATKTAGEQ